jgi:hypothetical protein
VRRFGAALANPFGKALPSFKHAGPSPAFRKAPEDWSTPGRWRAVPEIHERTCPAHCHPQREGDMAESFGDDLKSEI